MIIHQVFIYKQQSWYKTVSIFSGHKGKLIEQLVGLMNKDD